MQFAIFTPPHSAGVHVVEEVMLPSKELIQARVLCGSVRGGPLFFRALPRTLNRDKWLETPRERIDLSNVTCTRCRTRYGVRFEEFQSV